LTERWDYWATGLTIIDLMGYLTDSLYDKLVAAIDSHTITEILKKEFGKKVIAYFDKFGGLNIAEVISGLLTVRNRGEFFYYFSDLLREIGTDHGPPDVKQANNPDLTRKRSNYLIQVMQNDRLPALILANGIMARHPIKTDLKSVFITTMACASLARRLILKRHFSVSDDYMEMMRVFPNTGISQEEFELGVKLLEFEIFTGGTDASGIDYSCPWDYLEDNSLPGLMQRFSQDSVIEYKNIKPIYPDSDLLVKDFFSREISTKVKTPLPPGLPSLVNWHTGKIVETADETS
jgi:hypothetical protein